MVPRMKAWSRGSTLVLISVAASASVRAMARRLDPDSGQSILVSFANMFSEWHRYKLTHNIRLRPDRDETVDVLADGHKHLARHVAALLGSRSLILNVDASSALLDEQLCELHHGCQATVACIGVCYNRAQVVDVQAAGALCLGRRQALLALLAIVEKLRHEEVSNLVGDSGLEQWL